MKRELATFAFAALLPLGGCGFTSYGDAARDAVEDYGSRGADALLENSEFIVCRAAPVGAVIRRYGRSQETAEAWKTLCRGGEDSELLTPEAAPEAAEE